jgi:hypothetical protein
MLSDRTVLKLSLWPNCRCHGCGAIGYVEVKTILCLYCFGLRVKVEERKNKLQSTLSRIFAATA